MRVLRGITVVLNVYSQVVGLRDGYIASTESPCTRNTRDIRDSR